VRRAASLRCGLGAIMTDAIVVARKLAVLLEPGAGRFRGAGALVYLAAALGNSGWPSLERSHIVLGEREEHRNVQRKLSLWERALRDRR
jgi:hypothetical protein